MYLHPSLDPSFRPTRFFGEFPGLGLALVLDVVVPEASRGAHEAELCPVLASCVIKKNRWERLD